MKVPVHIQSEFATKRKNAAEIYLSVPCKYGHKGYRRKSNRGCIICAKLRDLSVWERKMRKARIANGLDPALPSPR